MTLDIQSYYEVTPSRVLITRKFSKKFNEKQEILDKKGKLLIKTVKKGNVNELKELLDESTLGLRYDNDFCLVFSCMNGYYHLVKILIQYGYLKLSNIKLYQVFSYSIEWSAKIGHLKILQFLLDTLKQYNELTLIKPLIEKISLRNYNYDTNYSSLLDDNQVNIKKSKEIIKKNNEFNKFNNRNRNANISMFNEMLINASNEYDDEIGVDYNENELDLADVHEEECDENGDDDEQDFDGEEKDYHHEEELAEEIDENLFGEDSDDDTELDVKKNKKKVYNSLCFRNIKKKQFYLDGKKSNKSKRMQVILWLLSQEYIINTNYYFISQYIVKYNLDDIINILKKHKKFMLNVEHLTIQNININDNDVKMN